MARRLAVRASSAFSRVTGGVAAGKGGGSTFDGAPAGSAAAGGGWTTAGSGTGSVAQPSASNGASDQAATRARVRMAAVTSEEKIMVARL